VRGLRFYLNSAFLKVLMGEPFSSFALAYFMSPQPPPAETYCLKAGTSVLQPAGWNLPVLIVMSLSATSS